MTAPRTLAWFGAILLLSLASRLRLEGERQERCSLDGNRIVPIYRVDQMVGGKPVASFCCVTCATEWPETSADAYWRVRDEVSGALLDASAACFVESTIVTVPARQDRTHVFKSWVDAMDHMAEFGGSRAASPFTLKHSGPPAPSSSATPGGTSDGD